MHVTHQHRAFFTKSLLTRYVTGKYFIELLTIADSIDAYINHRCATFHKVFCNSCGASDGDYQNIRQPRDGRQIARLRMAYRHRGVMVKQENRHGTAYNITSSHHHGV